MGRVDTSRKAAAVRAPKPCQSPTRSRSVEPAIRAPRGRAIRRRAPADACFLHRPVHGRHEIACGLTSAFGTIARRMGSHVAIPVVPALMCVALACEALSSSGQEILCLRDPTNRRGPVRSRLQWTEGRTAPDECCAKKDLDESFPFLIWVSTVSRIQTTVDITV